MDWRILGLLPAIITFAIGWSLRRKPKVQECCKDKPDQDQSPFKILK